MVEKDVQNVIKNNPDGVSTLGHDDQNDHDPMSSAWRQSSPQECVLENKEKLLLGDTIHEHGTLKEEKQSFL